MRKFGVVKNILNTATTEKVIDKVKKAKKLWSVILSVTIECTQRGKRNKKYIKTTTLIFQILKPAEAQDYLPHGVKCCMNIQLFSCSIAF